MVALEPDREPAAPRLSHQHGPLKGNSPAETDVRRPAEKEPLLEYPLRKTLQRVDVRFVVPEIDDFFAAVHEDPDLLEHPALVRPLQRVEATAGQVAEGAPSPRAALRKPDADEGVAGRVEIATPVENLVRYRYPVEGNVRPPQVPFHPAALQVHQPGHPAQVRGRGLEFSAQLQERNLAVPDRQRIDIVENIRVLGVGKMQPHIISPEAQVKPGPDLLYRAGDPHGRLALREEGHGYPHEQVILAQKAASKGLLEKVVQDRPLLYRLREAGAGGIIRLSPVLYRAIFV